MASGMARQVKVPMPTAVIDSVAPDPLSVRAVRRAFREQLAAGAAVQPAGSARGGGAELVRRYPPLARIGLFDHVFFVTGQRRDNQLRFLVAYVGRGAPPRVWYPRIFYKDSSLIWRVATHLIDTPEENWIGKGDVKWERRADGWLVSSAEETTNLPFELQAALDEVSRRQSVVRRDDHALNAILRAAPPGRMQAYADFVAPRSRAQRDHAIYGGRRIARFTRRNDPGSLRFARGFEPDFGGGRIDVCRSASRLYGGVVTKVRVLSANRRVQYQFVAAGRHVWLNPPQALTTELNGYGVRTVDAVADEELYIPGYEYHFLDEERQPPELHSQIPPGFAGPPCAMDPDRADASPWIEAMPVVRQFRRRVLSRLDAGDAVT